MLDGTEKETPKDPKPNRKKAESAAIKTATPPAR